MRKIEYHKQFEEELDEILEKFPSYRKKILNRLQILAKALEERGKNVLVEPYFEKLQESDVLYSLRLTGKKPNIRILFVFSEDTQIVLFVHVFYEKEKSDYRRAINLAEKRAKRWSEDNEIPLLREVR